MFGTQRRKCWPLIVNGTLWINVFHRIFRAAKVLPRNLPSRCLSRNAQGLLILKQDVFQPRHIVEAFAFLVSEQFINFSLKFFWREMEADSVLEHRRRL